MFTDHQLSCLRGYLCPACAQPLGVYHAYPIQLGTLLSRLTETVPMHRECALAHHALDPEEITAVYVVRSSSPTAPSGRFFERLPGDFCIHLFTPHHIEIRAGEQLATYPQIHHAMMPHVAAALHACASDEEEQALGEQIAWLHHFLPPRPKPEAKANDATPPQSPTNNTTP